MGNAKRIAGRIAAWAWGDKVFYTDSGTCAKCKAEVPTWDDACAECRPASPAETPADPRLGGKKPRTPDPLDALKLLMDDLEAIEFGQRPDTDWDSLENARRVIDAESTGPPGVQITGDPQTQVLTL